LSCNKVEHCVAISNYADKLSSACKVSADISIPHTVDRNQSRRIPGWSERIDPLRQKSLFWHGLWIDCGRPRSGVVADCMRRTRAAYHYAIRQARRDEENIVRERIAEALLSDPARNFWKEVKRIRHKKNNYSKNVDGYTDENSIAQVFASKYKNLYSSVPYDVVELESIRNELDASMLHSARPSDFVINANEVKEAIEKLKLHKSDGSFILSSDHFVNAGFDLSVHISSIIRLRPAGRRRINGVSPCRANMAIFNLLPKFQLSID
jgi:hypothetical protein